MKIVMTFLSIVKLARVVHNANKLEIYVYKVNSKFAVILKAPIITTIGLFTTLLTWYLITS